MTYSTPELLVVGSANNVVAGPIPTKSWQGRQKTDEIGAGYSEIDELSW